MSDDILKILHSHGEQIDFIVKKAVEHDDTLHSHGEQIDLIVKKVLEHDETFHSHGEQIDLIVKKVLEHDERLGRIEENMVTKKEHREVMNILDELFKLTKKKYEKLTMIVHGMRRHEDHFEAIDADLKRIKPALGLS